VVALTVAMLQSQSIFTRTVTAKPEISQQSFELILHSDLHIFPYKFTVSNTPAKHGKEQMLNFAARARHVVF
jgi:hypothetical protein